MSASEAPRFGALANVELNAVMRGRPFPIELEVDVEFVDVHGVDRRERAQRGLGIVGHAHVAGWWWCAFFFGEA